MYSMLSNIVQNRSICMNISRRFNNETFYIRYQNIKSSLMQGNKLANKYFAIWEQKVKKEKWH